MYTGKQLDIVSKMTLILGEEIKEMSDNMVGFSYAWVDFDKTEIAYDMDHELDVKTYYALVGLAQSSEYLFNEYVVRIND